MKKLEKAENFREPDWETIDGIVYRNVTGIHRTKPREVLEMDELRFPYEDEDMAETEHRILYYESSRGCPFSCSYCLSSIEKSVRIKSPEKTEEELDFFLRHRVPQVKFVDRTFNCNREYAQRIWKYIGEHDNGVTNFHFEISGDLLREEDIQMLASFRAGLVQFEIGVQSVNPNTIRAIRRTMALDVLKHNVMRVREKRNIHRHLDLIAGLPYEDYDSFRKSFNEVYAMKPDQLQLGFLKVLAGSYMDEAKEEYGIRHGSQPPYEVLATKWLSYEEIGKLKQVEEMVEWYYNSFQFEASVSWLADYFQTPFDMYFQLGEYYRERKLDERKHSRVQRYEILWDFVSENRLVPREERELFREVITFDLYRRDYVKNPPSFVKGRSEECKKKIRCFLDREQETPNILFGYGGYAAKQLFHMVYLNEFTVDFDALLGEGRHQKVRPRLLLFDYKKRNPLDHSAMVTEVLQCRNDSR